jgi:integrase
MIEVVEADEIAPKTVNNARTCLSVALNEAVRRGLIPRNPCDHLPALPLERREIDYLRLAEIGPYLEACGPHYRALTGFLIGTGARVSEAVATRWPDLDLDQGAVRIYRQRARDSHGTRVTKGKRFRSVQIGPRLAETLRSAHADRLRAGIDDGGWIFLCTVPRRGRYAGRTEPVPPHRKTVHEWHEATRLAEMEAHPCKPGDHRTRPVHDHQRSISREPPPGRRPQPGTLPSRPGSPGAPTGPIHMHDIWKVTTPLINDQPVMRA